MRAIGISFIVFFSSLSAVPAADYHVSPTGAATWSRSRNVKTPCSLETANANARAGDTVHLRGGTYATFIEPLHSGTSEKKRIVYTRYRNEHAEITGTRYAVHLDGRSFVSVNGIEFRNCVQFLVIRNGHSNDIGRCVFDRNQTETTWMGSWVHDGSTHNRIHDCIFSRFGWVLKDDDKGAILDIGYDTSTTDASDRNVIEKNTFFSGGHHILQICGKNNVVRGNYFHNEEWMAGPRTGGCGNRNAMTIGPMAGRNLFEDNRFAFAGVPPDDNGADGLVIRSPRNIVRRNACYANKASGIGLHSMTVSIPIDNYVYSNTLYHNGYGSDIDREWRCGIAFGNWGNGPMPGNRIVNNIMHDNDNRTAIGGYGNAGPQIIMKNWLEEGDPGFVNAAIPTDTADASLPDFRLKPDSPCIDQGVFPTKIASPAGKGKTFTVDDAGFFSDGWGIPGERGDVVQLEGRTGTARIVSVDYENNRITVDRAVSWTRGQGLSLAYFGKFPDLGAYEYRGK